MNKSWKEINEDRAIFWKSHIEQWSQTNLSQREYCRQNNLLHTRFTYWKSKFSQKTLPMELIQVPMPIRFSDSGVKLNIGRGLQVEIPDGFKQETLEQVLSVLKVVP